MNSILAEHSRKSLSDLLVQATDGKSEHVVTAVTIAEAYTDGLLRALIDREGRLLTSFGSQLRDEIGEKFFDSWDARLDWLGRGFNLKVAGERFVQEMRGAVDLRNALVHGYGALTRRQVQQPLKALDLEKRLKKMFAVDIFGGIVTPQSDTSTLVCRVCIDYVLQLDARAVGVHPWIISGA